MNTLFRLSLLLLLVIPAMGAVGPASFTNGNTIWVDGLAGNDATAVKYRTDNKFKTLTAAKNVSTSGDTIAVLPSRYLGTNLLKNGVNYYFFAGAIVTNMGTATHIHSASIFHDNFAGGTTNIISGYGDFEFFYETNRSEDNTVVAGGIVRLTNALSRVQITANSLRFRGFSVGQYGDGTMAAISIQNCGEFRANVHEIVDADINRQSFPAGGGDEIFSDTTAIYWANGECYFNCDNLQTEYGYGIWLDGSTNNMYYRGQYIKTKAGVAIYTSQSGSNNKLWCDVLELDSGSSVISKVAGSGKIYLNAQKLRGAGIGNQGQEYWITAQKFTAQAPSVAGTWFIIDGGKTFARILQYEIETMVDGSGVGINVTGGTNHFEGGFLLFTNGNAFKFSGAHQTRIKDMTIRVVDSAGGTGQTNWCIQNLTNGLTVQNIVCIAPTTNRFSVWSTNVINPLVIDGTFYNWGWTNSATTVSNGIYKTVVSGISRL